jgi:hypothetical protein
MGLVEALQDYVKNMTPRRALSDAAVALSPIPIVGDVVGGVDDAVMYYNDPEERTIGNYGMSLLGMLPFIPAAGVTRRVGEMDFDPRFDKRKKEQERLKSLTTEVDTKAQRIPKKSIYDLEGKPFITTMSDRTDAGGVLEGINNVELPHKVDLHGGQDYMFNNAGEVWASGKNPVKAILKRATDLKKQTGQDPLLLPWRMAPTGSDFAHMTGETMLSFASASMGKSAKKDLDSAVKKFIPDWKGVDNPESITQFKSTSDKKRKAIKNMLDKQFRNEGGLSLGEARLAISDPRQLNAREGGLMNVGQIDTSRGLIERAGLNTYPYAVGGKGIARLKEDVMVHQLLPEVAKFRKIQDVANPSQADIRSMQMKPYGGIITEGLLRALEKASK